MSFERTATTRPDHGAGAAGSPADAGGSGARVAVLERDGDHPNAALATVREWNSDIISRPGTEERFARRRRERHLLPDILWNQSVDELEF
jgi:hypothetical protein